MIGFANMAISNALAAAAYGRASVQNDKPGLDVPQDNTFADLVSTSLQNAQQSLHRGEQISAQGILGNADAIDVVTAVSQAELTLNTVVSLRDKVMTAYQEIMRMPI
jgi:flagellar hook-basal body complex protein FliE